MLTNYRSHLANDTTTPSHPCYALLPKGHEQIPLWAVIPLGAAFFVFGSGRFIPVQAICSLAIQPSQRGAFMSLNSCSRDLMAGLTSTFGGWMITTSPQGTLSGYDFLGWLAIAAALISLWIGAGVRNVEPNRPLPH